MPRVVFLPWRVECLADVEDTLLEAALAADIPLPHSCGGDAACSSCAIEVLDGPESLSPMEGLEQEALDKFLPRRPSSARLSCQTRIRADSHEPIRVKAISPRKPA